MPASAYLAHGLNRHWRAVLRRQSEAATQYALRYKAWRVNWEHDTRPGSWRGFLLTGPRHSSAGHQQTRLFANAVRASEVTLTREQWFHRLTAAQGHEVP
jgi:hypothetical protein